MAAALVPYVGGAAAGELAIAADGMEQVGYALGQEMVHRAGETLKKRIYDYMQDTGKEIFDNGIKKAKDWVSNVNYSLPSTYKGTYAGTPPYNTIMEADMGKAIVPYKPKKKMYPIGNRMLPPSYWYLRRKKRTYKRKKY